MDEQHIAGPAEQQTDGPDQFGETQMTDVRLIDPAQMRFEQ